MDEANKRGVNVGDINNNLTSQMNVLNNKMTNIGNNIETQLMELLNLEKRITKSVNQLVFTPE